MSEAGNSLSVCPICRGADFQPYKLGLVRCKSCDAVFSPTIWQPQANEQMEDEWFGADYQAESSVWVNAFQAWNNRKTLARLAQANPQGRRLLEIGVGSGSFLKAARGCGYEVMGCDLSASICERVCRLHGISMHGESLGTLAGENRFDVVVMNHVLEHVNQPIALLNEVRRLLAPGGLVHIAVPNIACWEAKLAGWTSYEPYHLAYFAPHTLERAVKAGGLVIERLSTHDSFSGWFLAVLRTALGINRQEGAVTRPASAAAGRATGRRPGWLEHTYRMGMVCAGGGTWPLRWLQARLGYGDEAICIARKPLAASRP